MSLIWIILLCVGIFYYILRPIIAIIFYTIVGVIRKCKENKKEKNKIENKQKKYLDSIFGTDNTISLQEETSKEFEKILTYAGVMSKYFRDTLGFPYHLVIVEFIAFYYFINDYKLVSKSKSDDLRQAILMLLYETLGMSKKLGFSNNKKLLHEIIVLRVETYTNFYEKYGMLTTDFLDKVFEYQTQLLLAIQNDCTFSKFNPFDLSPVKYQSQPANTIASVVIHEALVSKTRDILLFYKN